MKRTVTVLLLAALFPLAGAVVIPDPPNIPKRAPKVCKKGKEAALLTAGNAAIVIAPKASNVIRFSAAELSSHLGKVLGGEVKVFNAPQKGKFNIFLGFNEWSTAAGIAPEKHHRDAFTIKISSKGAFIAGKDDAKASPERALPMGAWAHMYERATLFGVYDFLERFAGVRFYFPGELGTIVPRKKSISLPETEIFDYPDFITRRTMHYHGTWPGKSADDLAWREKNLAVYRYRLETSYIPCCHGLSRLGYLHRFGQSHPEYFALMSNGKRHNNPSLPHPGSLCYSSGIREEVFQDVKSYLKGEPPSKRGVRYRDGRVAWDPSGFQPGYADIMPQDSYYRCHCKKCESKFGTGRSYATEFMWTFAAEIAKRLQDEKIPGFVTMMAYVPYVDVPKVELPSNLLVMVAKHGPWGQYNTEGQKRDLAAIAAWTRKLNKKVWLWTYFCKQGATAFVGVPSPNAHTLTPYYKDVTPHVFGLFLESETDRYINNYLTYYVHGKYSWDNRTDTEAIIAEHHKLMFGNASPVMAKLFSLFEKIWIKEIVGRTVDTELGPVVIPPSDYDLWHKIYNSKRMDEIKADFDQAEKLAAKDKDSLARVKLFRSEWLIPLQNARKAYMDRTNAVANFFFSPAAPAYLRVYPGKQKITQAPVQTAVTFKEDKEFFHFTFDCEEPLFDDAVAVKRPKDSTNVWQDSGVELFINPTGDKKVYYQFILNLKNSLMDQECTMLGVRSKGNTKWDAGAVTSIKRTAKGYEAVISIPKKAFPNYNKKGFPVNFGRNRVLAKGTGHAVLYTWSPFVKGFHDLENFGTLKLQPAAPKGNSPLLNGDFSAKPQGRFFGGWFADHKLVKGQSWALDKGNFFTAPPSLYLANAKGKEGKEMMATQYLPKLKGGTKYRLTAYIRFKDVKPLVRGGGIAINLWDTANRWYPTNFITGTSEKWVRQSFEFTTPADTQTRKGNTPYIRLRLFKATGEVWFDDVTLEEIGK